MDKSEGFFSKDNTKEQIKSRQLRGVALRELIDRKDLGMDQTTSDMLKLMLEQFNYLAHVEVVFISPEEEPNTGGFFHKVQVDDGTFVPAIFIVSENQEHMRKLKDTRRSSVQIIADMLGIDFSQLSPILLRQFIILHEIGHANDYVKNYENNPDYQGANAAEEWDLHYEANLLTMPVPGFDPVDLREKVSRFSDLREFLDAYPNVAKKMNIDEIKTLEDLLHAQEIAYRTSAYESYADNFAIDFLKNNSEKLNTALKILEPHFEIKKRESIFERQEIIAPPNFVSVFHETREEFLPAIDKDGLKINTEIKNIGKAEAMARKNALIDKFRPKELIIKGISRNNIYAYPFLEYGNGLRGAAERFVKINERDLRYIFQDAMKKKHLYSDFLEFWRKLGVNTPDEYVRKKTDPEYLKSQYPGEVVEMKVDPQKCYVGDLEYISRIMDDMQRGWSEGEATQRQAEKYWKSMVALEDFLRWYRKPEFTEDGNSIKGADDYRDGEPLGTDEFCPLKDAPDNFPSAIYQPEILIPEDIPQDHIGLVR